MSPPDPGPPERPDPPPAEEPARRSLNVDLFARRPAKRARAEGESIVVYRSGEPTDGGAEEASEERRARRAAEAALAAMRVAARRVQDLSGLVYELEAQLPASDGGRPAPPAGPEQVRAPDDSEVSELRAEAERNAAALVAAGDAIASLRSELAAAREHARGRAEHEREARRIAGELVETATSALARAEQRLTDAEATTGADRERARRAFTAKAAAEAEVGRLRHELAAVFAARDRERNAMWEQLHQERRELRRTEERLIVTIADKDARIEELERERAGQAGDETVAPGAGWLGRALVAIAERDPASGARLALGLLPLYGLACQAEADWDLVVSEAGAWRVRAEPGRLATLERLPAARGRAASFRVEADARGLAAALAGAEPRAARRYGRLSLRRSRRRARPALRELASTPLDLATAAGAGLPLDPDLAYLALAQAIAPAWTTAERFVVAHQLVPSGRTCAVSVTDGRRLRVTATTPPRADATVVCADESFLPLLAGHAGPAGEKAALRGDLRSLALLREWVARAQHASG